MCNERERLIVVTGPTCSGKSALAISLAERVSGELINADSVQVYRGFDIGSAKSSAEDMARVPHHLFSVLDCHEHFDAGRFADLARHSVQEIRDRQAVPIIVGGTGLYIRAFLNGLPDLPEISAEARAQLSEREAQLTTSNLSKTAVTEELFRWLDQLDPLAARRLTRGDSQRVRRALLVALSTGRSLADYQDEHQHQLQNRLAAPAVEALVLVCLPERKALYERIDARVTQMFAAGLVEEVRALLLSGAFGSPPMKSIGYRHVCEYLTMLESGSSIDSLGLSLAQIVEQIQRDTRQFAKRQYTWWRHQPEKLGWQELLLSSENVNPPKIDKSIELSTPFLSSIEPIVELVVDFLSSSKQVEAPGVRVVRLENFLFGDLL